MKLRKNVGTLIQIIPLLSFFFNFDGWAKNLYATLSKDSPVVVEQISSDDGIKENQSSADERKNCIHFASEYSIEGLKVVNFSSDSLTISWNDTSEEPVDYYIIQWYENEEMIGDAEETSSNFTFTIENLEACTTYKIRVTPSSGTERAEYKEITATTCKTSPSECVNLVANPLKIDGGLLLNVSWETPIVGRTCIKNYKVILGATIHGKTHTVAEVTNATNILIDRLYACTSYSVAVHAVDVDDEPGVTSEILAPPTLPKVRRPPRLVNKINVSPITSTSTTITLHWDLTDERNNCSIKLVKSRCCFTYGFGSGYELKDSENSVKFVEEKPPRNVIIVVDNLSPYTWYSCWGQVLNDAGSSFPSLRIPDILTKETEPSAPEDFKIVNNENFTFSWKAPVFIPGRLRKYRMAFVWEPLYPVPEACKVSRKAIVDNIDRNLTSYTWNKGEGYSRYTAYIEAQTGAGWGSKSANLQFDSGLNGVPDEVTNLRYALEPQESDHNALEAKLSWNLPCSLKGELSSFDISVHGFKDGLENHTEYFRIKVSHINNNDKFGVILRDLKPEYFYKFEIAALIHDLSVKGEVAQFWTLFPAGIPPEPEESYMQSITLHLSKILRTTSSFEILLPLFADICGDIRYYAVIVSRQDSHYKPAETRFDLKKKGWPNISSWRESMEHDFTLPYQVTEPYWTPYPNYILDYGSIKAVKFVVGNDITCKDVSLTTKSKLYCNGPLNPDTWYEVRMRAFTSGGYSDSPPILVKTKAEISAILIVSTVLGLLVLGMIVSMIIAGKIYFKRKEKSLNTVDEDTTDQGRRQSRRMTLTAQAGTSQDTSSRVRRH